MSKNDPKPPFLAFVNDQKDIDTLREFAAAQVWSEDTIYQGDIATAAQFLKKNSSPQLLLVEVPSAAEAPALLDSLAEVCDPDTKVIIIGSVNEYSFYCWLTDIGIFSYLLKPLTVAMLETAYNKSQQSVSAQARQEKAPGKVISVLGTRGGVGSTTLSINLAGLIADMTHKKIALVDIDPHEGSIALALDLEPSRGFREALEKPERIDSLFVDRVMTRPNKFLSILSSEESLQERVAVHDDAADILLKELRDKFDLVILDIPRPLNAFSRRCISQSDQSVMVTELTLLSLRDALRVGDLMREVLKVKAPIIVANRVGHAAKFETKQADFEKGINAKVAHSIPYAPDVFMQISTDIAALKHKSHAAVKSLYELAQHLVPDAKGKTDPKAKETKGGGGGLFSRKKQDKEA